jgi:hypothetical protein
MEQSEVWEAGRMYLAMPATTETMVNKFAKAV